MLYAIEEKSHDIHPTFCACPPEAQEFVCQTLLIDEMAIPISRRALTLGVFCILFALVTADAVNQVKSAPAQVASAIKEQVPANAVKQVKETSSHAFDQIKDKVSIGAEQIQSLLKYAAQKQADSQKDRSWTTKIFGILFPSSKPAVNALLATAYISGPPNFLLALCPPNIDPSSLSIMVAFAVGGLLGDTFFHLLPEIFLGEDESDSKVRLVMLEPNRNLLLGVFIFIGLATFMAMDKTLRIATGGAHSHSHGDTNTQNLDSQVDKIEKNDYHDDYRVEDVAKLAREESKDQEKERLENKPYNDTMVDGKKTRHIVAELAATNREIRKRHTQSMSETDSQRDVGTTTSSQIQQTTSNTPSEKRRSAHQQVTSGDETEEPLELTTSNSLTQQAVPEQENTEPNSEQRNRTRDLNPSVKLAGLLNLVADFTHNITDGLALSTSFYSSPALGATTTMAVFFHEIPHEVGDFALLIQSGFSKRSAMGAQFVTAIGAFIGTIIGILVQEYGSGETDALGGMKEGLLGTSLQWSDMLLPFTAGTFLYVGTVGVIPELLENEKGGTRFGEIRRTFLQFGAMALGALIMVAISWT